MAVVSAPALAEGGAIASEGALNAARLRQLRTHMVVHIAGFAGIDAALALRASCASLRSLSAGFERDHMPTICAACGLHPRTKEPEVYFPLQNRGDRPFRLGEPYCSACCSHPGAFVDNPGAESVLDAKIWSCCGVTYEFNPGCVKRKHTPVCLPCAGAGAEASEAAESEDTKEDAAFGSATAENAATEAERMGLLPAPAEPMRALAAALRWTRACATDPNAKHMREFEHSFTILEDIEFYGDLRLPMRDSVWTFVPTQEVVQMAWPRKDRTGLQNPMFRSVLSDGSTLLYYRDGGMMHDYCFYTEDGLAFEPRRQNISLYWNLWQRESSGGSPDVRCIVRPRPGLPRRAVLWVGGERHSFVDE